MTRQRPSPALFTTVPLHRVLLLTLLLRAVSMPIQGSRTRPYTQGPVISARSDNAGCADHCGGRQKATLSHHYEVHIKEEVKGQLVTEDASSALGSKPPKCVSKCGSCKPCIAVRVPVQPGNPNNSEYYPEAWRCKCGGKLYKP